MITTVRKFFNKDIIKVFSLNAISTFIRMLTGFISVKVVAVLIGPSGIALLGQLNNFSSIFLTASTGGINNGVTKYIAEHANSKRKISFFLRSGLWITAILSILCGVILIAAASYFSTLILGDSKYTFIFIVFGCTIILYSLNSLLLSILNGFKEFKKYVAVNITSSVIGLLFSAILTFSFGVFGALLSAVTFQSVIFIVTFFMVVKSNWFKKSYFIGRYSKAAGRKLAHYSLMAFVSASTVPVSQLLIRSYLKAHTTLSEAGLWEGMNRISGMYLMVITASLAVYYLPRLSEIKNNNELRKEIFNVYKLILPPLLIGTFSIYFFRNLIIHTLFNEKFEGMQGLFAFQLIGDFFKISSWILAYQMVAKSMTKTFIITEIVFSGMLVGLAMTFIKLSGNIGAAIAYAVTYIIYFLTMVIIFRKIFINE